MLRSVALAGVALAVLAGVAAGAPARDSLVRPGVGIGRITLGMTPAQVQRILGRHTLVNREIELGFGRRYVEHDFDYARWTVGYEGRAGRLRVVRVSTQVRTQRTPTGIGIGSRPRDILREYPSARCADRFRNYRGQLLGRYVSVVAANGNLTVFLVRTPWYGRDRTHRVIEVIVTQQPRLPGESDAPCPAGWQRG